MGLDFTVSPGKQAFRGAEEHLRLRGQERFKITGVLLDGVRPAEAGDTLWHGGQQVGVVTCGMYSRLSKRSMAIARVSVACSQPGIALQVRGSLEGTAATHALPFDDPEKAKRTAKG